VHGDRGTGKSGVLSFITIWAHKNNWIVVNVPNASKFTNEKTIFNRHHKTGLYV
jgi:hypothetical protein